MKLRTGTASTFRIAAIVLLASCGGGAVATKQLPEEGVDETETTEVEPVEDVVVAIPTGLWRIEAHAGFDLSKSDGEPVLTINETNVGYRNACALSTSLATWEAATVALSSFEVEAVECDSVSAFAIFFGELASELSWQQTGDQLTLFRSDGASISLRKEL